MGHQRFEVNEVELLSIGTRIRQKQRATRRSEKQELQLARLMKEWRDREKELQKLRKRLKTNLENYK